jgi:ATP-dependent 26S proteasome regulatory subunit
MNQTIVFGILLTLLILYTLSQYSNHTAHAHDFYITDDAYLVTLIEEIKAETQLVNTNFLSNNNISAIEHARNAAKITNDLNNKLIENSEDIVQVYDNELYNSTTLAMVVANLVDEILRKYGSAYDIKYDLTNMSNMDSSSSVSNSSSSFFAMNMTTTATNTNTSSTHLGHSDMLKKNNLVLVNTYDYQTAQVLSDVVNRLFSDELASQAPVNETLTIGKLEKDIRELKHAIDSKASAEILMEIAHIQIHPILQKAYDLKLVAVV